MPNLKLKYLQHLKEIMEDTYLQLREKGSTPEGRDDYINGFIDAGVSIELASNEEVQSVIEDTNMEVFGITIRERQKVYKNIELSYDEYIDVPTFFRKGKFTL
nr:hypothetical protein [Desulfobulbaceae bacterium]